MASTTSSKPKGRKYTNYIASTAGRNKRAIPAHAVTVYLTDEQHRQLKEWAALYNTTMSNLVGLSVGKFVAWKRADLQVKPEYFYVRLPDGTYHPPVHELGYEFQENAERFAHRTPGAEVVRLSPASRPR